jgi:hypothetical protein
MSATPVFCPKCGFQSSEGIRFCKRCGTNLEAVSKVLTGALTPQTRDEVTTEVEVVYAREMSRALYKVIGSIALFAVMMIVFKAQWWVLFFLFPLADAIKDLVHAQFIRRNVTDPYAAKAAFEARKGSKKKRGKKHRQQENDAQTSYTPGPPQTAYPVAAPTTGELEKPRELEEPREYDFTGIEPPSVTESTTRLLEKDGADPEAPRYVPPRPDAVPRK